MYKVQNNHHNPKGTPNPNPTRSLSNLSTGTRNLLETGVLINWIKKR